MKLLINPALSLDVKRYDNVQRSVRRVNEWAAQQAQCRNEENSYFRCLKELGGEAKNL